MKYIFIDTDNGGTPSNATPDTSTSKYHTTSSWPANGARWSSMIGAEADATIRALTDDVTFLCRGAADDVRCQFTVNMLAASITVEGDFAAAAPDSSKYKIAHAGASSEALYFTYAAGPCTVRNIQVEYTGSAAAPYGLRFNPGSGTYTLTVDSCFVRIGGSGASTGYAIRSLQGAAQNVDIRNTIVQQLSSPGGRRDGITLASANVGRISNCVVEGFNQTSAIGITNGDTVKNCAVFNNTDDFSGGTISYCASDDGDGTNAVTGLTWANEFEDYANGDFRLKAGSSLIGAGVDDPDSGAFSDDITGTTRSDWDIGAFEYVAASTPARIRPATIIKSQSATVAGTGSVS